MDEDMGFDELWDLEVRQAILSAGEAYGRYENLPTEAVKAALSVITERVSAEVSEHGSYARAAEAIPSVAKEATYAASATISVR